jgi:hypothetical protein
MEVKIPCPCPPKADGTPRHESDTVTLRDKLDFRAVTAIRNVVAYAKLDDPAMDSGEIMAILTEGYILHGIESWSLIGQINVNGKTKLGPLPATKPNIREHLLGEPTVAEVVGDEADGIYGPMVLLPLVQRALTSSPPSQMDASTSPKTPSSRKRQRPSKPSSTSTTTTAGTATITSLRGGDFNSSPSSATAA